ncbi:thymopoietin isoform X2 [Ornithorhynchus anatinus]|uniref:Thymopoietin n=1 Tax=Ornithorhynchus anatinus TaxID=9258 RepID=A0A6I8NX10_ORNAN|nr:thymopoietin isoform X2 [Ornithorhynchus anatinus]
MPEFLEDPSVLTKDKLKSELIANSVALPAGEQRKDVYVQLYLQHLTARNRPPHAAGLNNRGPPDFSSDEEREPTPVLGAARSRAAGRKATKKTDKPRPEEKDDLDVTDLTNEDLLEELVKYGVNPGPIVGTTRKLYEKKLLKLREQGPGSRSSTPLPTVTSAAENTRQNGNDDSDQYSDNEEDSKIELKLEKREPLKGKTKPPVTLKQRRAEHNQSYSRTGISETVWTSGSSKSGPLQTLTRESTRVSRRTPRKRVETAEQLRVDGAVITENTPIAETIKASSNETLVVNRGTGNIKLATPYVSLREFSDIPRRTPKKSLAKAEVEEKTFTEERRVERDILKEMFPYEASTPTGISASCRRPIRGAAGRPLELSEFRMEESFSSKYVPKYVPLADMKSEKTKKGRSIPMWIKILLFVVVAIFLFLVYQAMETNQGNPFSNFRTDDSEVQGQAK